MACGCVPISTMSGGPQDLIVDDYNGYNIEIGNFGGMYTMIDKIISDNDLYQRLSNNAIKTAKKYSWGVVVCQLEKEIFRISGDHS